MDEAGLRGMESGAMEPGEAPLVVLTNRASVPCNVDPWGWLVSSTDGG
jgi:hypothetical protein